ncbi:MAG: trypsin-like serine protease [Longispora sp.]|nr:trypsin-like serine protease [Longispora sp. (in: high G+C Gram-positive bacteria)]
MRRASKWSGAAVAAVTLVLGAGCPAEAIVGGTKITGEEFKRSWSSVVSLETTLSTEPSKVYACGGTYIGDRWVLTVAHCLMPEYTGAVMSPTAVIVRAGSTREDSGGVLLRVDQVHVHPEYVPKKPDGMANDIALVRLASDARLVVAGVRAAPIVKPDWDYRPGTGGAIAG